MIIGYLVECFIFLVKAFLWIFIGAIALTVVCLILTILIAGGKK